MKMNKEKWLLGIGIAGAVYYAFSIKKAVSEAFTEMERDAALKLAKAYRAKELKENKAAKVTILSTKNAKGVIIGFKVNVFNTAGKLTGGTTFPVEKS